MSSIFIMKIGCTTSNIPRSKREMTLVSKNRRLSNARPNGYIKKVELEKQHMLHQLDDADILEPENVES